MTRILCTFPGRYGDLAWALPSIRALSRRLDQPIDLLIAGEFASIIPLLMQQPYLGQVRADPAWSLAAPESWRATWPVGEYDHVFHLGYRGWPQQALPFEILHTLNSYLFSSSLRICFTEEEMALQTPWLTIPQGRWWGKNGRTHIAVGFTEAHFELKYGLLNLLARAEKTWELWPCGRNTRWEREAGLTGQDWDTTAGLIGAADVVLADCSALHVLAVALGTPVVCMEPMEARLNPIFWPLGMDGPQVTIVRGGDGQPTFDARHTRDTLQRVLAASRAKEIPR